MTMKLLDTRIHTTQTCGFIVFVSYDRDRICFYLFIPQGQSDMPELANILIFIRSPWQGVKLAAICLQRLTQLQQIMRCSS